MFDLVNGLPVHPLVVHAVVVLLPLACVGTLAIALRPGWRRRYGVLVVLCAAAAVVLIPVATSSGEALERHVGDPGRHAALGGQLIWFAVPLLVLACVLVWLDRRQGPTSARESMSRAKAVTWMVAVLALVAAIATSVQVYRVGDSGARAAWSGRVQSTPQR